MHVSFRADHFTVDQRAITVKKYRINPGHAVSFVKNETVFYLIAQIFAPRKRSRISKINEKKSVIAVKLTLFWYRITGEFSLLMFGN